MDNSYHKLFGQLEPVTSPRDLSASIIQSVRHHEKRRAQTRLVLLSGTALASVAGLVPLVGYLYQDFITSGLAQYAQLALSDNTLILTCWREFTLSLVEVAPLWSVTALLSVLGLFVWSGTKAVVQVRPAFYQFN